MKLGALLLMMVATPFGLVSCAKDTVTPIGSVNTPMWREVARLAAELPSYRDYDYSYAIAWHNYPNTPPPVVEIWRQLITTNPAWCDAMINRYIAWLQTNNHRSRLDEWGYNVWASDGFSPSRFFEAYIADFGSTNVATGASAYTFPDGQPSTPPPPSPAPRPDDATAGRVPPPPLGNPPVFGSNTTVTPATPGDGPTFGTTEVSSIGGLLALFFFLPIAFGKPRRHA